MDVRTFRSWSDSGAVFHTTTHWLILAACACVLGCAHCRRDVARVEPTVGGRPAASVAATQGHVPTTVSPPMGSGVIAATATTPVGVAAPITTVAAPQVAALPIAATTTMVAGPTTSSSYTPSNTAVGTFATPAIAQGQVPSMAQGQPAFGTGEFLSEADFSGMKLHPNSPGQSANGNAVPAPSGPLALPPFSQSDAGNSPITTLANKPFSATVNPAKTSSTANNPAMPKPKAINATDTTNTQVQLDSFGPPPPPPNWSKDSTAPKDAVPPVNGFPQARRQTAN